jgi:hypothetical protein
MLPPVSPNAAGMPPHNAAPWAALSTRVVVAPVTGHALAITPGGTPTVASRAPEGPVDGHRKGASPPPSPGMNEAPPELSSATSTTAPLLDLQFAAVGCLSLGNIAASYSTMRLPLPGHVERRGEKVFFIVERLGVPSRGPAPRRTWSPPQHAGHTPGHCKLARNVAAPWRVTFPWRADPKATVRVTWGGGGRIRGGARSGRVRLGDFPSASHGVRAPAMYGTTPSPNVGPTKM